MRLRTKRRFEAEVGTGALNDIMFFLMLFFLIISTLANPSVIKIFLPKTAVSQRVSKPPIILVITADKHYFINNIEVNYNEIEGVLIQKSKDMEEPTIILRADAALSVQDLVDVMTLGVKNQIKMVIATQKQ
ncbi:MAG: biopolymer transporter ExbD [Bacteroidia bacterium]|nr:biopolymer transporter ExbD [Bacteroidia bacterium]